MAETPSARLTTVLGLIDEANAQDPRREIWAGQPYPKELLYSQRMTDWLARLQPEGSELLRIAAHAQHIRRWESPRGDFPDGREGYLRWRTRLSAFHADCAAEAMERAGYDSDAIARVRSLLQKKRLREDPEAQALEDVACLVFLEFYFADFAAGHDEEKLIGILRKTWGKMSPSAQRAACQLVLPPAAAQLLAKTLGDE